MATITLSTATDPITGVFTSADGSAFIGLRVNNWFTLSGNHPFRDIYFERLFFPHGSSNISGLQGFNHTFVDCLFKGAVHFNSSNYPTSNIRFYNCIFNNTTAAVTGSSTNPAASNVQFVNSLFAKRGGGAETINLLGGTAWTIQATFTNNIFMFYAPNVNGLRCSFVNNMTFGAGAVDLNNSGLYAKNNIISLATGLVNFPPLADFNHVSHNLMLMPGSPAIGAGFNGTDLGVFGGEAHYVNPGAEPRLPRILQSTTLRSG